MSDAIWISVVAICVAAVMWKAADVGIERAKMEAVKVQLEAKCK